MTNVHDAAIASVHRSTPPMNSRGIARGITCGRPRLRLVGSRNSEKAGAVVDAGVAHNAIPGLRREGTLLGLTCRRWRGANANSGSGAGVAVIAATNLRVGRFQGLRNGPAYWLAIAYPISSNVTFTTRSTEEGLFSSRSPHETPPLRIGASSGVGWNAYPFRLANP